MTAGLSRRHDPGERGGALLCFPWRRAALAALSGLLLYLASPGAIGWAPLAWLALTPLFIALHDARPQTAALLGLTSGLCFYMPLLSWIIIVLSTYGQVHIGVALLALFLLALYMAAHMALFSLALVLMPKNLRLWFAPFCWVGLDALRTVLLTGFPWQDLAYSQYSLPQLIQVADLAGHHAVTFLLVLANSLLAVILLRMSGRTEASPSPLPVGGAVLLLMLAMGYNVFRYHEVRDFSRRQPSAPVAVIQGNIPQDQKWLPAYQEETVRAYTALAEQALAAQKKSLLIWPETALPFYFAENMLFYRLIDLVRPHSACLLTGTPHRVRDKTDGTVHYYNSSVLLGPDGRVAGQYHKQHLVPFGEYIPFRNLLPFFAPIVETLGDFSPGASQPPLSCGPARLGVLICFESIFPELARAHAAAGANLLVNITNDAWFGNSNAPWQHLSMAVFRAVENRRSLARAANTGISGFVLPSGELLGATPLFEPAFRVAALPLLEQQTIHTRAGHFFGLFCLGLALLGILITIRQKKSKHSPQHRERSII